MFQNFRDDILYCLYGEAEAVGYLLVGKLFLATEAEYGLFFFGELREGSLNELTAFLCLQELFGFVGGLFHICPYLADRLVIPGDFSQQVEGPVASHGIDVLAGEGDFGELCALFPDLQEDVLYDLFCVDR